MTDSGVASTSVAPVSPSSFVRWCFRVGGPPGAALLPRDADQVRTSLTYHRGWALLHARRGTADVPEELLRTAAAVSRRSVLDQLGKLADLRHAGEQLDAAGLRWLLVKGPVLAGSLYPSSEQRPYGDLDVLVAPADLRTAMDLLEGAGWSVLDRNWVLAEERMSGEVHLRGPAGTVLDLHWSLQNRVARRRRMQVDATGLLDGSVTTDLDGRVVRTTSWADTVVHLCTHACGDGADRLLALSDVARLLASPAADHDDLVHRAQSWAATGPTSLVVRRAARELGPDTAVGLVRRLGVQRGVSVVDAAVDRLFPVSAISAAPSIPGRWATRRMDPGRRWFPRLRVQGGARTHEESASNPYSLLYDAGGAVGREAYLSAVERAGRRGVTG